MNVIDKLLGSTEDICTFAKTHSPKLLSIGSSVLAVGACAGTGIATWKAKDRLEEHNANIYDLHEDLRATGDAEEQERIRRDILLEYGKTTLTVAGYYAVPAILLGSSIACDIASSKQYEHKLALASGALLLLKSAYDKAQERAKEQYGEEAAADIFYGYKEKEIETVDKKGNKKIEKVKEYDPYGIVESNPCAVLVGDGIDCTFEGGYNQNINRYNSIIRHITLELNAKGSVCFWDVATNSHWGLGLKPESKLQMDIWKNSGWVKSQAKIDNAIRKFNDNPETAKLSLAEYEKECDSIIENAQGVSLGIENYINRRYASNDEPMLWILPNCIPNYEDFLFVDQFKRFEELSAE